MAKIQWSRVPASTSESAAADVRKGRSSRQSKKKRYEGLRETFHQAYKVLSFRWLRGPVAGPARQGNAGIIKEREERMATDYLLKTEPTEYSFEALAKDKETEWDGVRNPVALRNLGQMSAGTKLVIYETGDVKSAVGTATVASVDTKDPKNPRVTLKAGKRLAKAVTLAEIKANKMFKDSPLVRMGRLSVVPLTKEQYESLVGK
jgi:predicted RNA-binding protein with PUA-like domain